MLVIDWECGNRMTIIMEIYSILSHPNTNYWYVFLFCFFFVFPKNINKNLWFLFASFLPSSTIQIPPWERDWESGGGLSRNPFLTTSILFCFSYISVYPSVNWFLPALSRHRRRHRPFGMFISSNFISKATPGRVRRRAWNTNYGISMMLWWWWFVVFRLVFCWWRYFQLLLVFLQVSFILVKRLEKIPFHCKKYCTCACVCSFIADSSSSSSSSYSFSAAPFQFSLCTTLLGVSPVSRYMSVCAFVSWPFHLSFSSTLYHLPSVSCSFHSNSLLLIGFYWKFGLVYLRCFMRDFTTVCVLV